MHKGTGRKRGSKDGAKGSVEDGWQNGRIIFVGRNSLEVAIPRPWRVAVNLWGRFFPIVTLRALPATWLIHSTGSIESDEDVGSFSLPPNSPSNLFDLTLVVIIINILYKFAKR
ncbi:hypothetical protein J1N35_000399 [Gossypium stocksii]|uniref:Uncharacterized protein n=1 Tax=Gossypium stocksii TaxID=47602 RepID=A0A9D3WI96_9ROSI|nr:hypothetical protein J1N35_000399 [Gossypium stocksii]